MTSLDFRCKSENDIKKNEKEIIEKEIIFKLFWTNGKGKEKVRENKISQ